MNQLEALLLDYATRGNPKSNEDLKRYLRRYPQFHDEIIEFTANWRALAILDHVLAVERQFIRGVQARLISGARRRRTAPVV